MAPYLFVFFALVALAALSEARLTKNARIALLVVGYVIVVLFIGLRWQTGTDWTNYRDYYLYAYMPDALTSSFGIGFRIVNQIVRSVGISYSGYLLIYTAIYIGIMTLCFDEDKYEMAGWLMLLFYSSFLIAWMGTARQIMAVAICLYSIRFILSRNWAKFLLCVAIATCFHVTALCFLVAWPAARLRLTLWMTWIALVLTEAAALLHVGRLMVQAVGNELGIPYLSRMLAIYANAHSQSAYLAYVGSPARTALFYATRLLPLLFFTLCFRLFKSERDQLYFKLYLLSVIIFVFFYEVIPMIPLRAGMYFGISQLFLMALLTRRIPHRALRGLYCIGLVLLCFARLYVDLHASTSYLLLPYKSIFYNQGVYRGL